MSWIRFLTALYIVIPSLPPLDVISIARLFLGGYWLATALWWANAYYLSALSWAGCVVIEWSNASGGLVLQRYMKLRRRTPDLSSRHIKYLDFEVQHPIRKTIITSGAYDVDNYSASPALDLWLVTELLCGVASSKTPRWARINKTTTISLTPFTLLPNITPLLATHLSPQ